MYCMAQNTPNKNPLLDLGQLPRFTEIKPEHVEPALDAVLERNREYLRELETGVDAASWATLVQPLEDINEDLSKTWSPVSHLNAVKDSDALRTVYESCLPELSAYQTELGQNERLYAGFKHIKEGSEFEALDVAQKKIIDNALRDFHLMGVDLPSKDKQRFKAIQQRLSSLGNQFDRNLLDATNHWHLLISDDEDLSGLPQSAVDMAQHLAEQNDQQGWRFTLDIPSYLPFMMHADNRSLREAMYEAYVTRAGEGGPGAGKYDNTEIIVEVLKLRHEMAQLLSFDSYAEMSLVTKMAESPHQVLDFLKNLAERARPAALEELRQVRVYAAEQLDIEDVQAWDIPYCSEHLKQSLYDFTQEDLRPYFPAPRVLSGMFKVVERLYGIRIERVDGVEVWDPQVEFYRITDAAGEVRGEFYVDLYVRPHKRSGAWMDDFSSRKIAAEKVQTPVAYLTCNFSMPMQGRPALLTHEEVTTLFHEFGHGLHHMLTKVDYVSVSGINGVAWDAVELHSQFMENWCWQTESLDLIGSHFQTGEKLPEELLQKMKRAKNFQSGLQLLRQIEFALFDMRLHYGFDPGGGISVQQLLDELRRDVSVFIPPAYNCFQNSFSHIFAGGYAAGYYSYKWAEVLSADAFSLFEEKGIFDSVTGQAFMHNILETGGTIEPMDAFVAFRGRAPTVDALLRHSGLEA